MKKVLLGSASGVVLGLGFAGAASAGNIVLTGHDNDLHCFFGSGSSACATTAAEASFVNGGTTKTILVIDNGTQLSNTLSTLGFNVVAKTVGAITAADFDNSLYGSFAVASVTGCGGCDNPAGSGLVLAGFSAAIASFFNAGGGILGMTGDGDPNAFAYVPESGGTISAIGDISGFVATAAGTAGIPGFAAVNGDQTHNVFSGFAAAYQVAEIFDPDGNGDGPATTIFVNGGTIICTGAACTITGSAPEPTTLALLGAGMFGLGAIRRRRQRTAA
jgi:hypothetical protein